MFIRENTRGEGQMFLYKDGKFTELGELAAYLSSEIAANGDVEIVGVYEMASNGRFIVGAAMKNNQVSGYLLDLEYVPTGVDEIEAVEAKRL